MPASISIAIDTAELEKWGAAATKLIRNNARSAINAAAVAAKKSFATALKLDANAPTYADAMPPIVRASAANLTARWTPGKHAPTIRAPGGGRVSMVPKGSAVSVSTFKTTGGGSASINNSRIFTISTVNGVLVMKRMGPGRGAKLRALYAENPAAAMRETSKPEHAWEKAAVETVVLKLPLAIAAAFSLASVPDAAVDDRSA